MQQARLGHLFIAIIFVTGVIPSLMSFLVPNWCVIKGTIDVKSGNVTNLIEMEFKFGLFVLCTEAKRGRKTANHCDDTGIQYKPSLKRSVDAVKGFMTSGFIISFIGLCFLILWCYIRRNSLMVLLVISLSVGGALTIIAGLVYGLFSFVELKSRFNEGIVDLTLALQKYPGFLTVKDANLSASFAFCIVSGIAYVGAGLLGFRELRHAQREPCSQALTPVSTRPSLQSLRHISMIAYALEGERDEPADRGMMN